MSDKDLETLLGKMGNKIADAIKGIPATPAPPTKKYSGLQWLGIITAGLTILGSLLGGIAYIVANSVESAMKEPNKQLATLVAESAGLRRDVDRLLDKQAVNLLQKAPAVLNDSGAKDIKLAADHLLNKKIPLAPIDIQAASKPLLVNTSYANPEKWDATKSLLNLRSFVNSTLQQAQRDVVREIALTDTYRGTVQPPGPITGWTKLNGGEVVLDAGNGDLGIFGPDGRPITVFNKLIFSGTRIIYRGGKVTLLNVFFENCTFDIKDSKNGQLLAQALLSPSENTSISIN